MGTRGRGPREIVHRGVVEAAAILVDEALAGPLEARRRVVAAWSPGASVHRLAGGILLRFPAPRSIDCARAPGLPLVRIGAGASAPIASAPLAPDELSALAPPPGAVLLVRGGALSAAVPADADAEDPAAYLDLAAFTVHRAEPLGAPARPPAVAHPPEERAAREVLGIAAAPAERALVLQALAAAAGKIPGPGSHHASRRPLSFLGTIAAAFASLLARLLASRAPGLGSGSGQRLVAEEAEPEGPTLRERFTARLRLWSARVLVRTRLLQFVVRRQAEYLERLLDMLDRGDLGEALRHAIPLGGGTEEPVGPMLGVPSPRSDLSISLAARRSSAAMFGTPDLYDHLRRKYRAAFERLSREGRIDEAAFVLAELLHEAQEAVAFLERHGRLRLAAELAEARRMAPGVQVRQWLLAGDTARAVRIARRHGAFADAVQRLGDHEHAGSLRLSWAETLAAAGDFAAAVEVIWPVESARNIGAAWIDRAIAQGGAPAARMLVKKLHLLPASFPAVREAALALFAGDAPAERRAFAEALISSPPDPGSRALARAAARALLADGARQGDDAVQKLVGRVVTFADDAVLRADLPAFPTFTRTPLARVEAPKARVISGADAGAVPLHDAAYLPSGRVVVALGEAGVRVLGRDGRAIFHLDQPACDLVIADLGDRALAVAPRGDALRLARLNFSDRRAAPWCEARLDAFARDFDGSQWVVAEGDRIFVIDALEARLDALHTVEPGGPVGVIGRDGQSATVLLRDQGVMATRVRFELPSWFMRARKPRDGALGVGPIHVAAGASGAAAAYLAQPAESMSPPVLVFAREGFSERRAELSWPGGAAVHRVAVRPGWIACAVTSARGADVQLVDEEHLRARFTITLEGASRVSLRFSGEALTLADDRGRLLVVDLALGGVVHDLRIT